MASKLDLCNLALTNIGQSSVSSLNVTGSIKVNTFLRVYDLARDFVLADHDWNFAEKRAELTLLSETPTGYSYGYAYPSDCLKFRSIYQADSTAEPLKYSIGLRAAVEAQMIMTDEEDAVGIYTKKIELVNLFSPAFRTAISWKLGADMAFPITKNLSIQQNCLKTYVAYIAAAERIDANEKNSHTKPTGRYKKAR